MKKREYGLDLFRLIGAFWVVHIHVAASYISGMTAYTETGTVASSLKTCIFYVLQDFGYWAVPCFLMISGAFSIANPKTKDFSRVYSKLWKKMVIPTLVFTLIYAIERPLVYLKLNVFTPDLFWKYVLKVQLPDTLCGIPSEHMWYMYVLIVLTLMSPCIVMMKETLGEKKFTAAAILLQIWGMIDCQFYEYAAKWNLGYAINLAGTFMLGYVIHEHAKKTKNNAKAFGLFAIGSASAICLGLLDYYFAVNPASTEFGAAVVKILVNKTPYNIFVVFSAICMMAGFTMLDCRINVGYLGELTYWVYLDHILINVLVIYVDTKMIHFFTANTDNLAIMLLDSALVYLLSFVLSHLIVAVQRKRSAKKAA